LSQRRCDILDAGEFFEARRLIGADYMKLSNRLLDNSTGLSLEEEKNLTLTLSRERWFFPAPTFGEGQR
jgi:hypothetical protein